MCYFDDDTAAPAEILVSGPEGDTDMKIAILGERSEPFRSFMVRVWRRFAPEIWVVDREQEWIEQIAPEGPSTFLGPGDVPSSSAVPGPTSR